MNDFENTSSVDAVNKIRRLPKNLLSAIILITVCLLIIVGLCIYVGTNVAHKKDDEYADRIKELKDQIADLVNHPIVIEPITPEVDLAIVNSELKTIGELATMEYLYTDANRFSDSKKVLGINLPAKSFVAKWDGVIKAGIRIEEVTVDLDKEEKVITVHLPAPAILSHEIKYDTVETLDEKSGLFNPIKVDDVNSLYAVSKDAMEKRAQENGLLEKSLENAKEIIKNLIFSIPGVDDDYTVDFQIAN